MFELKPATIKEKPPRTWKAWLIPTGWRILRVPFVVYLGVCLLLMWFENSLTYMPTKAADSWQEPTGLTYEDAEFASADGTKLHGWYVPNENATSVVLFCHGNAGNISHRYDVLHYVQQFTKASILAFDYRGYGKSEGAPSEAGVLADAPARGWAQRAGVKETDIVLWGESIGGAVAVDLAAKDGARGLILEDTFTSLPDMAAYHYPWLPVRLLMRGRLNTLALIGDYHGPLLMCHGDADTIVPIEYGRKVFAAAHEPKRWLTQPGANHNDERCSEFVQEMAKFLRECGEQR